MMKQGEFYSAGRNEIHRYGKESRERVAKSLEANEKGFYSIATDGGKFWTIGTSEGKFGEFAKIDGICFSVNRGGFAWAKAGTEKGDAFVKAIEGMIAKMNEMNAERIAALDSEDED